MFIRGRQNSFSLETSLSVDECLQKLREHLVALRPLGQWYGEVNTQARELKDWKIQLVAMDEANSTFHIKLSTAAGTVVLTAQGHLTDSGSKTIIKGQIQHAAFYYLLPLVHINKRKNRDLLLNTIKMKLDAYPWSSTK
jgi:hypothetical protein